MIRILLLSAFLLSTIHAINAEEAVWLLDAQTELDKAFEMAQKEKKPMVLLVIIKDGCIWCERMVNETLKDKKVKEQLNDLSITVIKDFDEKRPSEYNATLTPTLFFIDAKKKNILQKIVGYEKSGSFLMDIVSAEEKVE